MNPQTNSSTPRDDENEYQALNIGVIEQRRLMCKNEILCIFQRE